MVPWKFCHWPAWHWFSPGRGREQKLEVSAWRSVSRCWWRRPFRPLSCITSPSSRSTAARMLSTCFCRAALRSSYSMWVFRSCRISASRAVRPQRHAKTLRQWQRSEKVKWYTGCGIIIFFICAVSSFKFFGQNWCLKDYSGIHLETLKEEGCLKQSAVGIPAPHLCCGWEIPLWRSVCQTLFGLFPRCPSVDKQKHKEERTSAQQWHGQQQPFVSLDSRKAMSDFILESKEKMIEWEQLKHQNPLTCTLFLLHNINI